MLNSKQNYILLLVFLLFPAGVVYAAWSEPTQAPTGGNASVPVYSEGTGQTITGTLHVDPSATNAFPLKANGSDTAVLGAGAVNGLQGTSVGNALYGNLTANGASGGRSVYGLAVDAGDYGLYASGGLGLGLASGDIWFLQRNAGVGFPHTNAAYGSVSALKVAVDGETQIRSLGNGINFMKVTGAAPGTLTSLLSISEAGVVNVVNDLKVSGGGAFGGYDPSATHKVTTPTLYTEQGQVGGATGGLKGVGTLNAVQLCIQGDCRPSWGAASPTPSLQAVTDVGAGTTQSISAGVYVSAGNGGNRARLGELNSRGGLYTEGETWLQNSANKTVFSDPANNPQMTLTGANLNLNGTLTVGGKVGIDGSGVNPGFSLNASNIQTNALQANYLDALGNAQIRFDSNGDGGGANNFHINNGANITVLTVNETGDLIMLNNKSLRLDSGSVNTSLVVGNYGDGGGFSYGTGKTASLAVEGDVKGNQLCIKEDCKASWSAIGNVSGWTLNGSNLYPNSTTYNVGIGNAAPGYKLDVQGGSVNASGGLCINGDCKASWAAVANASGWTDGGTIVTPTTLADAFSVGTATPNQNYSLTVDLGPHLGAMWVNGPVDITGGNLRVVTGSVGVGSANPPGYRLAVVDDGSTSIINLDSDDVAKYYTGLRLARQGSEKWFVGIDNSTDKLLLRRSGSSNDVVVDTNGNVGIGTAAPNKQLHIKTASGNAEIDIQSAGSAYWAIYQDDATDQLRFWNNNVAAPADKNVLTLDDNGFVGIGTTSPARKLHVYGDAGAPGEYLAVIESPNDGANLVLVTDQASGDYATVGFRRGAISGTGWNVGLTDNDNNFKIQSRPDGGPNTDRLTIDQATGAVNAVNSLCIAGNCKTGNWGAVTAAYGTSGQQNPAIPGVREYVTMGADFNQNDYFCSPGYVVIGFRNKTPGELICGKMW